MGIWTIRYRALYNSEKFSKKKALLLESIPGWNSGELPSEANWKAKRNKVETYMLKNGGIPPCRSVIGQWCAHQRLYHRQNELSEARVKSLSIIPGWFWETSKRPSLDQQE